MRSLNNRVEALERHTGGVHGPAAWIIVRTGETEEQAHARYEEEHGPIGERFVLLWRPYQENKQCA